MARGSSPGQLLRENKSLKTRLPKTKESRGEMLTVVGTAEHCVRHEGIHCKAMEELAAALPKPTTPAAKRLRKQLPESVRE